MNMRIGGAGKTTTLGPLDRIVAEADELARATVAAVRAGQSVHTFTATSARFFSEAVRHPDLSAASTNELRETAARVADVVGHLERRLTSLGIAQAPMRDASREVAAAALPVWRELATNLTHARALDAAALADVRKILPHVPDGAVPIDIGTRNLGRTATLLHDSATALGRPAYALFNDVVLVAQPRTGKPDWQTEQATIDAQTKATVPFAAYAAVKAHAETSERVAGLERDEAMQRAPAGSGEQIALTLERRARLGGRSFLVEAALDLRQHEVGPFLDHVTTLGFVPVGRSGFEPLRLRDLQPSYLFDRHDPPFPDAEAVWKQEIATRLQGRS